MIINRAPALGTLGGAGRRQARSQRGGLAGPGGSSKPGGLRGGGNQALFGRRLEAAKSPCACSAPRTPTLIRLRSNLSAWPSHRRRRASVGLCAEETSVSAAPEPRGAVVSQEANPSSSQLSQVLRSAPEHHPPGCD